MLKNQTLHSSIIVSSIIPNLLTSNLIAIVNLPQSPSNIHTDSSKNLTTPTVPTIHQTEPNEEINLDIQPTKSATTKKLKKCKSKGKKVHVVVNRSGNTSKPKSRLGYYGSSGNQTMTVKKARSGKVSPVWQKTDSKLSKITGVRKINKSKYLKVDGHKKSKNKLIHRNVSKVGDHALKTKTSSEKLDKIIPKTKGVGSSKTKKISRARRSQEYDESESLLDIKRAHSKSHKAYKGNMKKWSGQITNKTSAERANHNYTMLSSHLTVGEYEHLSKFNQTTSKYTKIWALKSDNEISDSIDEKCDLDWNEASEGKGHVTPRVNPVKSIKVKYSSHH